MPGEVRAPTQIALKPLFCLLLGLLIRGNCLGYPLTQKGRKFPYELFYVLLHSRNLIPEEHFFEKFLVVFFPPFPSSEQGSRGWARPLPFLGSSGERGQSPPHRADALHGGQRGLRVGSGVPGSGSTRWHC